MKMFLPSEIIQADFAHQYDSNNQLFIIIYACNDAIRLSNLIQCINFQETITESNRN